MKRIILLLLAGCSMLQLYGQGAFKMANGATVNTNGDAWIVLNDISLENNGDLQQTKDNGNIRFTGNNEAHLLGSSTTTINNLWLNKGPGSKLNVLSNIAVVSELNFGGGLLNLGNSVIDLGTGGKLNGEVEDSRAYTTGTGYLQAVADLSAPQAANPGNLGATITSGANMGNTIVRRGHAVQAGINGSGQSIQRYYEIVPTNNKSLNATLRLDYFDAELNGLNEASLTIWKNNSGSWILLGATSQDIGSNYIEKTNVQNFSRMTLAEGCPPITVDIPDVYAVKPGGAANTLYIGYGPTSLTLSASITGGTGPYTYRWTLGSPGGTVVGNGATLTVSPKATTTYYLALKDASGCSSAVVSKTINVVDVRCGAKLDKVTVCVYQKGKYTTSCVTSSSVANYLAGGSYLGACQTLQPLTTRSKEPVVESNKLTVSALPNPTAYYFTLVTRSGREEALSIRIIDVLGRVIESRTGVPANSSIQLGHYYRPGIYFVEVVQGNEKITVKMVKRL